MVHNTGATFIKLQLLLAIINTKLEKLLILITLNLMFSALKIIVFKASRIPAHEFLPELFFAVLKRLAVADLVEGVHTRLVPGKFHFY